MPAGPDPEDRTVAVLADLPLHDRSPSLPAPRRAGTPGSTGKTAVETCPAATITGIPAILLRFDLAVFGLGALAFVLLFWADIRRSSGYSCNLRGWERAAIAIGHGLAGVLILFLSSLIASALGLRFERAGEGIGGILLCIGLAYVGFSSFGLAWKALRSRPSRLLLQVHLALSVAATVLLLLLAVWAPVASLRKGMVPLALAGVILGSLLIALWQYRGNITRPATPKEGGAAGGGACVPVPGEVPARATSETVSPFPRELSGRFADPVIIGTGGLSRVFRARRKEDGRVVAVKVPLALDEATGKAFLREMRAWEGLSHPNILPILGANILPVPYVEMEYLPRSLEELGKPVDLKTAARIVAGIARGLAYAHARGIIHRDLKPGNILLTRDLEPKIGDWGLSRFLTGSTVTDVQGFSPRYAAPEQVDPKRYGPVGPATDIHGLGAIFYELVTGRPAFGGDGIAEITHGILSDVPVPPSAINPDAGPVDGIILRCLEKEPGKRYRSAADLERDLLPFTG